MRERKRPQDSFNNNDTILKLVRRRPCCGLVSGLIEKEGAKLEQHEMSRRIAEGFVESELKSHVETNGAS